MHDHGDQVRPPWLAAGWFDFALITGFARKTTCIAAAVFSVLIWATAEGFGGPYTSGASEIGTALIYAAGFAGVLALSYYTGPSRYTADYYLGRKYSWWWRRLADLRRPAPALTSADIADTGSAGPPARPRPGNRTPPDRHHRSRSGTQRRNRRTR